MKANENTIIVDDELVLVPYRKEHVAVRRQVQFPNPVLYGGPQKNIVDLIASRPLLGRNIMSGCSTPSFVNSPRVSRFPSRMNMKCSVSVRPRILVFSVCGMIRTRNGDTHIPTTHAICEFRLADLRYPMLASFRVGKWQEDEDKLTFIVCVRTAGSSATTEEITFSSLTMIGDVNLFLKGVPSDEDFEVEAEIMIAESTYRRRGYASRALQLLLSYATAPESPKPLPIPRNALVVRIGEKNEASIRLFERLEFVITKRVEVFEEVEMRYCGGGDGKSNGWRKGLVRELHEAHWSL